MKVAVLFTFVVVSLLMFNKTGEESSAGTNARSMSSSAMMKVKIQDRRN